MKVPLRSSSALAVLVASMIGAASAQANLTFNLSNVRFSSLATGGTDLGTLTGTFTTNDARTTLLDYSLTASASGAFLGFVYTPATAPVNASVLPSQYFQLDSAGNANELRLYFASPLTASGATISPASSYEHEPSGGNRFPSGSVQAVPEPSAFAALGLGAVAMLRRRKRA